MFEPFSLFILGLIVGSFLNVLGLRWNSGLGISGRSFCQTCGKRLSWWELLPVVSFLFLKARCSRCRTKISWLYPIVELWTGALFVSAYFVLEPVTATEMLKYLLVVSVFCIYTVIGIYDLRHKIIPDELVYSSIVLAFVFRLFSGSNLGDWFIGPAIFIFLGLIWFFSRGRALGFGDAKLGLSIGLLLGFGVGLSAFAFSFWLGAIFGLVYLALIRIYPLFRGSKKITMKSEIPFAPFMILGAWLAFISQFNLLHVSFF